MTILNRRQALQLGVVGAAGLIAAPHLARSQESWRDVFPRRLFRIAACGMVPTIKAGALLLADQTDAAKSGLKRGDVVVFRRENGAHWVKRLIGLPGETIAFENGAPLINGASLPRRRVGAYDAARELGYMAERRRRFCLRGEDHALFEETAAPGIRWRIVESAEPTRLSTTAPQSVPSDSLFLVGDNRDNSLDSRWPELGPVRQNQIIGRVIRISQPEVDG